MTPSIARWIAWFLVVAYVILAAIGLSLQGLTRAPFGPNALPVAVILVTLQFKTSTVYYLFCLRQMINA